MLDKMIGKLAFLLWDTKEGGVRLAEYQHLKRLENAPTTKLIDHQSTRLRELLIHANLTSPWYSKQFKTYNLDLNATNIIKELQKLPITTKSDIRENTDQFISTAFPKATLNQAKTGGSTGVSLNLYFDEKCQQFRNAAQMYADNLAQWEIGDKVAAVWGNPPIAKTLKEKIRSYLLERTIYLDTMDLNSDSMNHFASEWKKFNPTVIFGHSHSIYVFAKFLLENNIQALRPRGIVTTSMMLLDSERKIIEEAFACAVTNRYGCEEVGLIGVECEKHEGMHLNTAHLFIECLDENNTPVDPGTPGKIVITDFNNLAMPLLRYRVEDVGVLSTHACSCGRTTPLLERLEGRVADFLKKADGGQVAGVSLVERTLTKIPGIEQMQLVQEDLHKIMINRVKGSEFNSETDRLLLEEFRLVFDANVEIIINDVNKIPQEKSGKYRFSICKI